MWSSSVISAVALVAAVGLLGWGGGGVSWVLVPGVPALSFCAVGLVLRLRVPDNPIGWLFVTSGLALALGLLLDAYAYAAASLGLPSRLAAAAAANLLFQICLYLLPALLFLFPDGRLPSPRWRPLAMLWTTAAIVVGLGVVFQPGGMVSLAHDSLDNPLAASGRIGTLVHHVVGWGSFLVVVVGVVVAAGSLVWRYRRASADLRQQLKWFGSAAVLFALTLICLGVLGRFAGTLMVWRVGVVALPAAFTGVIVATGIAILRYRLYEIDVIIRRTLIYATLLAALSVVYFGGIYLVGRVVEDVAGQSGTLIVTISTLTVAVAFHPLRIRIQRAVDSRFYRARYDATETLHAFTTRLRSQIELEAISADVLRVVNTSLQPRHAVLWLRPVGASTRSPVRPRQVPR